ncbi:RING finger protein 17 [Cylas formicarius]|uniref:RING finger protein 17 n=1 Tax=Cylas formicarius TaxID=197179 RepID=UPI0029583C47|nr:RING finger protein 17 [Cylas formicarius]
MWPQEFNPSRPPFHKRPERLRPSGNSFYTDDMRYRNTEVPNNPSASFRPMINRGTGGSMINSKMRMDGPNARGRNFPMGAAFVEPLSERGRNSLTSWHHRMNQPKETTRDRVDVKYQNVKENTLYNMYVCPQCDEHYSYRHSQIKYQDKIPLVLPCCHTVCQECIFRSLSGNSITCPVCQVENKLSLSETPMRVTDLQQIFHPNYYLIGVISYHKPVGSQVNLENIKFVSTVLKQHLELPPPSERCCFVSCKREATVYCPDCEGIFCSDCSITIHQNTKKLMAHKPEPRKDNKLPFVFQNCPDHPKMQLEFFCEECDLEACCYCILNKHHGHEKITLYCLEDGEKEEFSRLKTEAQSILHHILKSQKKAASFSQFNADSVKKGVCSYFVDFHAKVFTIEKSLCQELNNVSSNSRGLNEIQSRLSAWAEELKKLLVLDVNGPGEQKLNFRSALAKLREVRNIPAFLINEKGSTEPARFIANPSVMKLLDEGFSIEKYEDSEYKLVTADELPNDYVVDDTLSDSDLDGPTSALLSQSVRSEDSSVPSGFEEVPRTRKKITLSRKTHKQKHHNSKRLVEKVEVQHINSMDSFFVHYKSMESKLNQLNKDIENYIKLGGAQLIRHPQINNLYLAHYISETHSGQKEQRWCRGRLVALKNGETEPLYNVFFIDYGKTQTVNSGRIKDIPPFLQQIKPMAFECMLFNPMNVDWNKRAHYTLAKTLNGKEVYMMVKSENCGILEVDLMISSTDGGMTSVIDILVHGGSNTSQSNDESNLEEGTVLKKQIYYPQLTVFPNSNKFEKNQKERVVIANVIDPHNIIVHLASHQESFKSMLHSLKKSYKHSEDSVVPIEGTYVLVEYRDPVRSNWHRAYIKQIDCNGNQAHVNLLDWGLTVIVSMANIRPLQEAFTKLECQAVVVKMAHIQPFNKQPTWSSNASLFLQAYLRSQDILKMVVHETENGVEVALFDMSGQVDLCLNTMMVENSLADSTGPISTRLEWPQYETAVPDNNQSYEEEDLIASMLEKANDESEEEDATNVRKRQVDVVKVVSPDLIWVKFLDLRHRESMLYSELQIHYNFEPVKRTQWEVGETCVVELENEFARGKVLGPIEDGWKVYLVDKIVEVDSPADKMYEYDTHFSKYLQAVTKTHLVNVKPAGDTGNWSISSVEALQAIFDKHKRIFVHKPDDADESEEKSMPVNMWYGIVIRGGPLDPDRIKYVSINNLLVKLGFAYKKSQKKSTKETIAAADKLLSSIENAPSTSCASFMAEQNDDYSSEEIPLETEENYTDRRDNDIRLESLENEEVPIQNSDVADIDNAMNWIDIVEADRSMIAKSKKSKSKKKMKNKLPFTSNDESKGSSKAVKTPNSSPYRTFEISIDDWKPPFRLSKREFRAKVTCVETGGHLYLHEEAIDEVYRKMEANIKEYFDSNPPLCADHNWEPGHLCTIRYNDGKWYRGRILKIIDSKKISVLMIDFGSDHEVSPDILFREVLYTDINAFATKVKLDKIHALSGKWLTSDYDSLLALVTDWCRIIVKGPLEVDMPNVEAYNEDGLFINQRIIEICPNLSHANFPQLTDTDDEECVVIENEEVFDTTDGDLDCAKYVSCEDMLDWKYKQRCVPKEMLAKEKVRLEISGVMSYNQVALKEIGENISEDMYNLTIDIQDYVNNIPLLKDFKVGVPCVAQYSVDEVWYRARVKDVGDFETSGVVEVIFVDYGNLEWVPVTKIRAARYEWLQMPQESWEARLNFELGKKSEAGAVFEALKSLIGKKRLVELVKPSPLTVDIYDNEGKLCYQTFLDSEVLECHS